MRGRPPPSPIFCYLASIFSFIGDAAPLKWPTTCHQGYSAWIQKPSKPVRARAGPEGNVTPPPPDANDLPAALAVAGSTSAVFLTPIYSGMSNRCSTRFKECFKVRRLSLRPAGSHMPLNLYLYALKRRRRGGRHGVAGWWHLCARVGLKLYL